MHPREAREILFAESLVMRTEWGRARIVAGEKESDHGDNLKINAERVDD